MLSGAAFIDITGVKLLTGAFGVFPVIRNFAGDVITRTGRNTFFEIRAVIRTEVGRFLSFGTGGLGVAFLTTAFGIVEVIVIAITWSSGRTMPVIIGIIAGKLIAGTG